ncbi:RICIN domain-containing protein [Actinomadura xylanilytica]|uniref:RICIN domain-containing protein n=1 Tax=Actinomadura xylanilytica TaxID=887459 RepID=UPI00255AFB72|nr:RICIN domain-containing protein [Actinomadura xylanilytica]MDL4772987.1 RICIN domain-containing protein [Actinomadura xylanilytica]
MRDGASFSAFVEAVRGLGIPARTLLARTGGTYRITTDHPTFGPGCMGVLEARTAPGAFVFDDHCGDQGANAGGEDYRLERVSAPARGFRLRPVHSGLCLGIPDASTDEGTAVHQLPCAPAGGGQVFQFDPDTSAAG